MAAGAAIDALALAGMRFRVSPSSTDRALRLLDAAVKALETRGYPVVLRNCTGADSTLASACTGICVGGEEVSFGIEEVDDAKGGPRRLRLFLDEPQLRHLRRSWLDASRRPLERCLAEFVTAIIVACEAFREQRRLEEQRKKEERQRRIAVAEPHARKLLRSDAESRIADWRFAQELRAFASAVRAYQQHTGTRDVGTYVERWSAWALREAERLDAMVLGTLTHVHVPPDVEFTDELREACCRVLDLAEESA